MAVTFEDATASGVHTDLLNQVDAGGAAGYINIEDSGSTVLGTLPLDYPCGTVSASGVLNLAFGARDESAANGGTAANAKIYTSTGTLILTLTCASGTAAVADTFVMSSLTVVAGQPIEASSGSVG